MHAFKTFEDISAWQKGRILTKRVYAVSGSGTFSRDYGLRDQIRKASVSILSNIAEGFDRTGNKEFVRFLNMAKGSCAEVRAQLYVAQDQNYLTTELAEEIRLEALEVSRMLAGLVNYLKKVTGF